MVSAAEHLAPSAAGRSTRQVVKPLSEKDTRAIVREEIEQAKAGLIDDARRLARQEAVGSVDEMTTRRSISTILLALLVSAAMVTFSSISGVAGVAILAIAVVALSVVYAIRS